MRASLLAVAVLLPSLTAAQSRIGLAADAAALSAPSASAGASLSALPAAVPSLLAAPALSPSLSAPLAAAPSLSAVPAAAAPLLAAPLQAASPLPFAAAAALPSAASPAVSLPGAVSPSARSPSAASADHSALPPNLRAVAHLLDDVGSGGTQTLSDEQLVELTHRLAGEDIGHGEETPSNFTSAYLRPGKPFAFSGPQAFRYQVALKAFKSGRATDEQSVKVLLDSARELAAGAGIEVMDVLRPSPAGEAHAGLRVVPRRDGSLLNRFAYDLDRRYKASLEYVPQRLIGAVAAYNSQSRVLFLPDFGRRDAFEAILHETAHAEFTERLANGDVSVFHTQLVAWEGRAIAPGASSYVSHMSLEEVFTHGKEVKHQLAALRREGDASLKALLPTLTFLYQYADVLRSARLNLALARSYVKNGHATVVLAPEEGEPFPGGHWYRVSLPYGRFFFPARDEAAPKRNLLKRVFTAKPETAGEKALRRRADALLPAIAEIDAVLVTLEEGLKSESPDLAALNAEADRIAAALRRAESSFKAP